MKKSSYKNILANIIQIQKNLLIPFFVNISEKKNTMKKKIHQMSINSISFISSKKSCSLSNIHLFFFK